MLVILAMQGITQKQREYKKKHGISFDLPPIDSKKKKVNMVHQGQTTRSKQFKAPWRNKNLLSDMLKRLPDEDATIEVNTDSCVIFYTYFLYFDMNIFKTFVV